MTKKDYQEFARTIYRLGQETDVVGISRLINEVGQIFTKDNPRFDYGRFAEACETGKCRGMKQ